MQPLRSSWAVSVSLESYVRDRLAESDFFSGLSAVRYRPVMSATVFGQYYLWRTRFTGGSASASPRARRLARR